MLIPIGTEVRPRKAPVGNYLLIALNVVMFLLTDGIGGSAGQQLKNLWALYAAVPDLGQYITYQFLHGDWMHLLGNMLFLWIFGNAVCDRMGSLCYVLFYLAGGIFAGVTFAVLNDNALMGASGSIAAVTTAFLALYPRVRITMLLWVFIIIPLQVPALLLIVFKIILWDNMIAPGLEQHLVSNVAHSAHLGGYSFGFCVAMSMLAGRLLPRNQFDLLAVWNRWHRRSGLTGLSQLTQARPVRVQELDSRPLEPLQLTPADQLREEILERVEARDFAAATELYLELRQMAPQQVLPRQAQLEVANHLAQAERHVEAADAYEAFLAAYPSSNVHEVHLLLGLIYSRYLQQWQPASEHLRSAADGLRQPGQRTLAEDELQKVEARLYGPPDSKDS